MWNPNDLWNNVQYDWHWHVWAYSVSLQKGWCNLSKPSLHISIPTVANQDRSIKMWKHQYLHAYFMIQRHNSALRAPRGAHSKTVWVKAWCRTANLRCATRVKLFLVTWDCNDWLKRHTFSSSIHFSCWTSASLWKSSLTSSSERSAGRWDWGLLVLDCGKRNSYEDFHQRIT